ncbi:MAG: AAA family ATPase, partial [Myxococcales bacterium]|nr:AAA family ATPase [Myxococcales bacterium]
PLIGRADELADLAALWSEASRGVGQIAVVEGRAGIGKTRLVDELLGRLAVTGARILSVECVSESDRPYAALGDLLDGYAARLRRLPQHHQEHERRRYREALTEIPAQLVAVAPSLAAWLGTRPQGGAALDESEQCHEILAAFVADLLSRHPAAIHIDGLHALDSGSEQVFRRLLRRLPRLPLLLVLSHRPLGSDQRSVLLEHARDLGAARIEPRPLTPAELRELVVAFLGSERVPSDLVDALIRRGEGTPLLVREYLLSLLESGALYPTWIGWSVDLSALRRLDLPRDVLALGMLRIDALSDVARRALAHAAVWGERFTLDGLEVVTGRKRRILVDVIAEGMQAHIIEGEHGGALHFTHDRFRHVLLNELDREDQRRCHRAVADWLAAREGEVSIYELARHTLAGYRGIDHQRVYQTCAEAGEAAVRAFADHEALAFLTAALEAGRAGRLAIGGDLLERLGEVSARLGRMTDALQHFGAALERHDNPLARARVWNAIADAHLQATDLEAAHGALFSAFESLGVPYPRASPRELLRSLWMLGVALFLIMIGRGGGRAPAGERERIQLHGALLGTLANVAYLEYHRRQVELFHSAVRRLYLGHLLGDSALYARGLVTQSMVFSVARMRGLSDAFIDRAEAVATAIRSPNEIAHVAFTRALMLDFAGDARAAEPLYWATLERYGDGLPAWDYTTQASTLIFHLVARGHCRQAEPLIQEVLARLGDDLSDPAHGHPLMPLLGGVLASALVTVGRNDQANIALGRFIGLVERSSTDRINWTMCSGFRAYVLTERGELGAALDGVFATFEQRGLPPAKAPPHASIAYTFMALARLGQWLACEPHERPLRAQLL